MTSPRVLIVEAGLGNIGSVAAALDRLGVAGERLSTPPEQSEAYTHLLLPGVGSFATGMEALVRLGWQNWLHEDWIRSGRPLLGICLGMQLLATRGWEGREDGASTPGLDLIAGEVSRLEVGPDLPLPHVGWNTVEWLHPQLPLAAGFPPGGDLYFVHSYGFRCADPSTCLACSEYGTRFSAVVGNSATNTWGMQFHPEKSQKLGRRLLENFLALTPC
jgi:glutamine amidotransferase